MYIYKDQMFLQFYYFKKSVSLYSCVTDTWLIHRLVGIMHKAGEISFFYNHKI